jgi:hypothetical protein
MTAERSMKIKYDPRLGAICTALGPFIALILHYSYLKSTRSPSDPGIFWYLCFAFFGWPIGAFTMPVEQWLASKCGIPQGAQVVFYAALTAVLSGLLMLPIMAFLTAGGIMNAPPGDPGVAILYFSSAFSGLVCGALFGLLLLRYGRR